MNHPLERGKNVQQTDHPNLGRALRCGLVISLMAGIALLALPLHAALAQSADNGFNPSANGNVNAVVVQAEGRIVVGGDFTTLGGQTREYIDAGGHAGSRHGRPLSAHLHGERRYPAGRHPELCAAGSKIENLPAARREITQGLYRRTKTCQSAPTLCSAETWQVRLTPQCDSPILRAASHERINLHVWCLCPLRTSMPRACASWRG
jgi:hypothetical protein